MSLAKDTTLNRTRARSFDAVEIYGHSWTTAPKVAQAANWWAMLCHSLGVTPLPRGIAGTRITQASSGQGGWDRILNIHARPATGVPARHLAILMHGLNDAGYGVSTSLFIAVMRTCIRRLQASAVIEETDASLAYTGTWTPTTSTQCSGGAFTKTSGTSATVTLTVPAWVPAGSLCVLRSTHDTAAASPFAATNGGTYAITKNGVSQADWSINAAGALGTTTLPDGYEVTVSPGDVLVLTASAVTSEIRFDGYDIVPPVHQRVLIALPARARGSFTTYTGVNTTLTQATFDAAVQVFNTALAALCSTLGVDTFDLERTMNREAELFQIGDPLHPNAAAQPGIARAAIEGLGLTGRREIGTPAPYGEDYLQTSPVARTASVAMNSGTPLQGTGGFSRIRRSTWMFNVSAVSGTSPSLTLRVVGYQSFDGLWFTVASTPPITAVGKYVVTVDGGTPDVLFVEADVSGTTPSFTYDIIEVHQGLPM